MFTISDILQDVNRGCMAHNMIEDRFSYRIIYFVNDGNKGTKHYIDTLYSGLRMALENIIRNNLSLTNTIVISAVTVRKNGKGIQLLSRSYAFSLDGYFQQINGNCQKNRVGYVGCGKYAVRA